MSRIGLKPILIPAGVKVAVNEHRVTVEGPKGRLEQSVDPSVSVAVNDNHVVLARCSDEKQIKSFHGLYRSLINNMIQGVSAGFSKTLMINGVGYRAEVQKDHLVMNLGFSSPVWFAVPEGISVKCETPTKIIISGINKQAVGEVAAQIRSLRMPEPYKGKGIRYEDEVIRRKVGKSGVKK